MDGEIGVNNLLLWISVAIEVGTCSCFEVKSNKCCRVRSLRTAAHRLYCTPLDADVDFSPLQLHKIRSGRWVTMSYNDSKLT